MPDRVQLTRLHQVRYSGCVAEKKATEFGSSIRQRRTSAARRLFFVRTTPVRLFQWAAVVGSLRAAGFLCHRSSNPAICRPPRLEARSGSTVDKGDTRMSSTGTSTPSSPKAKATRRARKGASTTPALSCIQGSFNAAADGFELTPDEMKLIQAYRKVGDVTQQTMVRVAQMFAQNDMLVRRQPKPTLALIAGGAHV